MNDIRIWNVMGKDKPIDPKATLIFHLENGTEFRVCIDEHGDLSIQKYRSATGLETISISQVAANAITVK